MSTQIQIKKNWETGQTLVEFGETVKVEDREYFRSFFHCELTRDEAFKLANELKNPRCFLTMDIADNMEG